MTNRQKELLIEATPKQHPVVFVPDNPHTDESMAEWLAAHRPYRWTVRTEITDGVAIGIMETAYGLMALWNGKDWELSKQDVSHGDYMFLGDYHGYSGGALFKRVNTTHGSTPCP